LRGNRSNCSNGTDSILEAPSLSSPNTDQNDILQQNPFLWIDLFCLPVEVSSRTTSTTTTAATTTAAAGHGKEKDEEYSGVSYKQQQQSSSMSHQNKGTGYFGLCVTQAMNTLQVRYERIGIWNGVVGCFFPFHAILSLPS
jgi:hypothetical protein